MGRKNKNSLISNGKVAVFYALSMLFSGLYLFGHINQLQSTIIGTNYFNITNMVLCLLGVLEAIIPVFIVMGNYRFLKIDLYAIGGIFIFGNIWFLRWLYVIIASGVVSFDFAAYQLAWNNMFNHTIWASRNAESLLLNYLSAMCWFSIAWNIDRDKMKTCSGMILMILVTFVLPVLFFGITRGRLIPEWWIKKSIPLFVSYASMLAVMVISSQKKSFWGKFVCPIRIDARQN